MQPPTPVAEDFFSQLDILDTNKKDYQYRLQGFLKFVSDRGLHIDTFLHYKRYLASLPHYSVSTKNKYLTVARIFLKELHRRQVLPTDITHNIKSFRQIKKHKVEGITEEEMQRITDFLACLSPSPATSRLRAILALLIFQGLRQCEVVRLDVNDLDIPSQRAYIKSKGAQDKEPVYLHPQTTEALKHYLSSNKVADGALFVSKRGTKYNQRLTTRGLRLLVTDLLRQLGISKPVHGFRHFFVSQLVKSYKGDLLEVSRYTRHRSLEMLQVYNDNIKLRADLPRYYKAFSDIHLNHS